MRRFALGIVVALVALVALVAAACSGDDDHAATTSTSATVTTVPSSTTVPPAVRAQQVVYFMHDATVDQPQPFLVPVDLGREGTLADALTALLNGPPSVDELELASPAFRTQIPDGTRLLGVEVTDGIATVDLSSEFDDGAGSATMLARLAQLVYTATRFPGVDEVALRLEGAPVDTFSSEGISLDGALGRDFFDGVGVLPRIFLDQPAWSAKVTTPMQLAGRVRDVGSEGIQWAVTDGDMTVASGTIAVTGKGWQDFSAEFVVSPGDRLVTVEVFQPRPGEAPRDLVEYPLLGRQVGSAVP